MLSGSESNAESTNLFENLVNDAFQQFKASGRYSYDFKLSDYPEIVARYKTLNSTERYELLMYCLRSNKKHKENVGVTLEYEKNTIRNAFVNNVLKSAMELNGEQFESLVDLLTDLDSKGHSLYSISRAYLIKQLSEVIQTIQEENKQEILITKLENTVLKNQYLGTKEKEKIEAKIQEIRNKIKPESDRKIQFFVEGDVFGVEMNRSLQSESSEIQLKWDKLFVLARTGANGSKPSAKLLKESNLLIKELGVDLFKKSVLSWFQFAIKLPEGKLSNADIYYYEGAKPVSEINTVNTQLIRSFIWMCSHFYDAKTLGTVYQLAERSYKKVANIGQESTSLGNACVYTLFVSKGLDGIGLLSRLRLKIRHNSTQALILKYLNESAAQKGVSLSEIEDMATDDFGLENGERTYLIDDYKAILRIEKVGKCDFIWEKENGTIQKSIPAQLKATHADKLKKIKSTQKQIEQTLSAQRDRMDRLFRIDRYVPIDHFQKYYVEHGLLSFIAKKLIWILENETKKITVYHKDGEWITQELSPVSLNDYQRVKLWHPVLSTLEEVQNWRTFLLKNEIQQPLKQSFREVYLLTEAEFRTKTYSNRMAAHILRQHQFANLARGRNWVVGLQGAWDNYGNENARLEIPEFGITAEYWIDGLYADESYSESGILNYVATDQIRFIKAGNSEPMDLIDVPPVLFSEVLRDTDLFVGVASIGNDPNWQDSSNGNRYADYWASYSFGDLSEVAKNRRGILENLIPRLKIAPLCEMKDKFLVVKGKLRTYKIHIGSTNILMEPNDQYLCIVQDRASKPVTDNLFIPFEGDQGLAIIISKAMLLAADDKITDSSILTQIKV